MVQCVGMLKIYGNKGRWKGQEDEIGYAAICCRDVGGLRWEPSLEWWVRGRHMLVGTIPRLPQVKAGSVLSSDWKDATVSWAALQQH